MKYIAIIVFMCGWVVQLDAQVLPQRADAVRSTLDSALRKRSVGINLNDPKTRIPVGKGSLDTTGTKRSTRSDSVKLKIGQASGQAVQKGRLYGDSIHSLGSRQRAEVKAKASALRGKIDSLKSAGLSYDKYAASLDSLQKVDEVLSKLLQKTGEPISSTQLRVQELSQVPADEVEEKLGLLSKEAEGQGNLPSTINLPASGPALDKIGALPVPTIPDTSLPQVQASGGAMPSLTLPANVLDKNISTPDLPSGKVADVKGMENIKVETGAIKDVSDKVSGVTQDIKDVKTGDSVAISGLEKNIISRAPVKNELGEIQKQEQALKKQQAMLESLKKKEEYKKQTLLKAKQMAAVHYAAVENQLQESISKVSGYQNKAGTILSKKDDLPKRRDSLKKLKMFEKFVPGVTLQIQKPGAWLVDINPSLRYRLTSYWSVGTGWSERVLFGKQDQTYRQSRIFGARTFTEVVIFKGFSFRLDAESMNAFTMPRQRLQDESRRRWVWSYLGGIKKDFSFAPRVLGNVQFMYTVYPGNGSAPYPTRLNVRFGFEFIPKKKSRHKQVSKSTRFTQNHKRSTS